MIKFALGLAVGYFGGPFIDEFFDYLNKKESK